MLEIIAYVLADIVLTTFCLWCAAKITAVDAGYLEILPAVVVSSLASLIPTIFGTIASIGVLFYLLKRKLAVNVFPDLFLMAVVSKLVAILLVMMLSKILIL